MDQPMWLSQDWHDYYKSRWLKSDRKKLYSFLWSFDQYWYWFIRYCLGWDIVWDFVASEPKQHILNEFIWSAVWQQNHRSSEKLWVSAPIIDQGWLRSWKQQMFDIFACPNISDFTYKYLHAQCDALNKCQRSWREKAEIFKHVQKNKIEVFKRRGN